MSDPSPRRGWLSSFGPAIITASVVLGPGSILSASRIGFEFGYQMVWVLALAVCLMVGMTALSARLGVMLDGTLCEELAKRAGRPVAVLIGLTLFLIVACFQFGNNLGVLAAIEPFYKGKSSYVPILIIVNLNLLVIVALFGFKALYQPAERLMKILVGLMMVAFAGNLLMARPDIAALFAGLMPQLPEGVDRVLPIWEPAVDLEAGEVRAGKVIDRFWPVTAMVGTTFSVAGAFYQSYLVRQKGWTRSDLKQGFTDSAVGICALGLMTLMIMITAAAVLYGKSDVQGINSVTDMALQLEPAFGRGAVALFCMGIFAGAFSSLLANAMIGGSMLSDGLGLGGYIDQRWPKFFTVLALAVGLNVAIAVKATGEQPVNMIIFAQAMTVLGFPVLAGAMLWLATRSDLSGDRAIPLWMKLFGGVALAVTLFMAARTALVRLLPVYEPLQNLLGA